MSTFRDLKRIRIGFGPRSYDLFTISNIAKDKSFVDDLNKERGIVSMRVGFVLRSTEIKPLFQRFVLLWTTLLLLWVFTTGVVSLVAAPPPN